MVPGVNQFCFLGPKTAPLEQHIERVNLPRLCWTLNSREGESHRSVDELGKIVWEDNQRLACWLLQVPRLRRARIPEGALPLTRNESQI